MSKEIDFDKVWKPVDRVIEYQNMDYPEAVTIGGQFSILKAEIERLRKENKRYRESFFKARAMIKYGDEHKLKRVLEIIDKALESDEG